MTRVKICGITRQQDARLAVELGASALGFNFYPPSPRHIEPSGARRIISQLPPFVVPVGVFAGEVDASHIAAVAREAGVATVQVHGPQLPRDWTPLAGFRIIRALAVDAGFDPGSVRDIAADAILLDGCHPLLAGGTGKIIDWKIAGRAARQGKVIILAGGLTAENVGEAIRTARPFAVDVASGVESAPGIKDAERLRAFFAAVAACSDRAS